MEWCKEVDEYRETSNVETTPKKRKAVSWLGNFVNTEMRSTADMEVAPNDRERIRGGQRGVD